ncbi:MAG TPA: hypothetical protein VGR00_13165 [Thermoanaerobaculia bacterium]|nr:hypothetical protein [Thermoanaerobaculia bacterium]
MTIPRGANGTATVETGPEGEVVTLRPAGCARYGTAAFLAFWLCGWFAGEVAALAAAALLTGILSGDSLPAPIRKIGVDAVKAPGIASVFLLVWLTLWTLGGVAALAFLVKLLFGVDRFVLRHDGFELRPGPFGKRRFLDRSSLAYLTLRPNDGSLTAELKGPDGAKSVSLTSLGTPADREWLRDLLRERYSLPRERPGFAGGVPGGEALLPADFETTIGPDGALLVMRRRKGQRQVAGCAWAVAATGAAFFAAIARGDHAAPAVGTILVSLVVLTALWCTFAREWWVVRPGVLESRLSFPGFRRVNIARDATLVLSVSRDSDGDAWYDLRAHPAIGKSFRVTNSINNASEPIALGRYLAEKTGFRLDIPPEARD